MTPQLFRRLQIVDARQGTQHILDTMPADCFTYNHASWAENVQALSDEHGKTLYWYVNAFFISDEYEDEWTHEFSHRWWHYCEDNNLWLKYKSGAQARFPWYREPRLVNLGLVTEEHAQALGSMIDVPAPYMADLLWPHATDWMLTPGDPGDLVPQKPTVNDLADYSGPMYLLGVKRLLGALPVAPGTPLTFPNGEAGGKCTPLGGTFLNGWYDWDESGHKVMYENADVGDRAPDLGWTVARWQANPGSVLSLERDLSHPDTMSILKLWVRAGGILECMNPVVAEVAWGMKENG